MSTELLVCGTDADLLSTRARVLSSAGFSVNSVVGLPGPENRVGVGDPALVIFCHTFSTKEQIEGSLYARNTWPHAKVLLLNTGGAGDEGPETHFNIFDGPAKLVGFVRRLSLGA